MKPADNEVVDATLASTLDTLDDAVNYLSWIVELARPHLTGPILELGAGQGTFTSSFADISAVHAVEPGDYACSVLGARFAQDDRVAVTCGMVDELPSGPQYGSAVMVNVLEHIEDDFGAVSQIADRLRPGAHLVVWVPAFMFLYSQFDHELGHHRRYRRGRLNDVMTRAGLEVVESRYVNLPGWFSWLLITRLLRQRPTSGPLVKLFDRYLVPVTRAVETRIRPPLGQSILIVAQKPFDAH